MKIRIEFNGASMTATLYDNPSTRNFASMLPLDLTIDDYSTNEKIAYLPRKLTEEGSGPFDNEKPGDLGYVAHLRGYRDVSESSNIDIGASYASGHNAAGVVDEMIAKVMTLLITEGCPNKPAMAGSAG